MAVENLQQYTFDEFEALADSDENRDRLFELIDGEIVEKVSREEHGIIADDIYASHDSLKIIRAKARFYLSHGTRLVWLVNPEKRLVEAYMPEDELILNETDTLSGEPVLPGFSLPVQNILWT